MRRALFGLLVGIFISGSIYSQDFGGISWGMPREEVLSSEMATRHKGDLMKLFSFDQAEELDMGIYTHIDLQHELPFSMAIVRYHFLNNELVATNFNYQPYETEAEIDPAMWAKMVYDFVNTVIEESYGKPKEKDMHHPYLYSYDTYWSTKKYHIKNSFGYKDPYCYSAFQDQHFREKYIEKQEEALFPDKPKQFLFDQKLGHMPTISIF